MERAESTASDLVVIDVCMSLGMGDDGLRAAQVLRERWLREGYVIHDASNYRKCYHLDKTRRALSLIIVESSAGVKWLLA